MEKIVSYKLIICSIFSKICLGQTVELFQVFRTNRTVTCDESSYGLNTS
jgi:hypothetical protein